MSNPESALERADGASEDRRGREPEKRNLAYEPADADPRRVVEQLVRMANGEGGTVVVGVRVGIGGFPSCVEIVGRRAVVTEEVSGVIEVRVQRRLGYREETFEVESKRLLGFPTSPER